MHFRAVLEVAEATSAPTTKAATDATLGPRYARARTAFPSNDDTCCDSGGLDGADSRCVDQLSRKDKLQKSDRCDRWNGRMMAESNGKKRLAGMD